MNDTACCPAFSAILRRGRCWMQIHGRAIVADCRSAIAGTHSGTVNLSTYFGTGRSHCH